MVEIASAANLGLAGNSLAALKLTASAAGGGRNDQRVAVNIANGNLIMQQLDEALTGRGPDLSLLRTYNSQGVTDYDNNDNWRIGFNRRAVGDQRVNGVTAEMDTRSFDWQRIGAAIVGSMAATFTMHADDLGAAQDSLAVAQRSLTFDANVVGYVRAGRG